MLAGLSPRIQGLILDMDGVMWSDTVPIGNLAANFAAIAAQMLRVVAATNNATRTVAQYIDKLKGFGVALDAGQIITSSDATARVLSAALPRAASVFVVGEDGVIQALRDKGFVVITDPADKRPVQAVVGGFDREFTYDKMLRAAAHIRAGAAFYGTNGDATFPTSEGLVPGAGAVLAAITTAAEKQPIVVGKPSPFLFELAAQRMNLTPLEILVVGDRLETDIAGGQAFGARTALVLSGVSTRESAADWRPAPDLIAADLARLVGA
jgi:4-nitrophenyl phosphatase